MEDDLNILVNGSRPPKLKTNCFKEQHSTVTSRNLTNTTTQKILAPLKKQKTNQPLLAVT